MLKLGHVITQWVRSLWPRPVAAPRPSLRALELISRVPPPPPPPPPHSRDVDYPSRSDAERYLSHMVADLRELALESPEVWGHAAAIADRLDGHSLEGLEDCGCFYSILADLQGAQAEAKRTTVCSQLTTITSARSYGETVEAWLRKNRP